MKKLIWKPGTISWQIHMVIAIVAIIGLIIVESFQVTIKLPTYNTKVIAAQYMNQSITILRNYRTAKIGPVNTEIDPFNSGLIGYPTSPITSINVDLDSKLTTINPNWAAVIVDMLKKAGVKKSDTIAVSFTGSFPAINLAVLSAAKAMNLQPIIITSLSSSTWGANIVDMTWLDMEHVLHKSRLFPYASVAASLGGVKDRALGMTDEGTNILKKTIRKYGIRLLDYKSITENIDARMSIYESLAGYSQIKAYVNVGGGTVAVGSFIGKRRFKPGLNTRPSRRALRIDSVMSRFAREDIPVINMNYMKKLARKYNLPTGDTKRNKIGKGDIFYRRDYNKALVVGVLLFLTVITYVFLKMGIGHRIFPLNSRNRKQNNPEHMI